MGLKNKNSIFDLSNGPVSDMETQQGPQFQRTIDEATDKSIASLGEVPITSQFQDLNGVPDSFYNRLDGTVDSPFQSRTGDHMVDLLTDNAKSINSGEIYTPSPNKSQFQDLNGVPGPQSQLPITDASQRHIDSLTQQIHSHNGGPSTNHYNVGPSNLDLNGAQGPQSQLPIRDASERHIDSLTKQIQITNQGVGIFNEPYNTGPSTLDLNGLPGPAFNRGKNSTLKQDLLSEIYQSSVNPLASYGAGQPGGDWPSVKPSPVGANFADLDGRTPRGYVNPDTGVSY